MQSSLLTFTRELAREGEDTGERGRGATRSTLIETESTGMTPHVQTYIYARQLDWPEKGRKEGDNV